MESFARLLQSLVVLYVPEYFVEVNARFLGVLIRKKHVSTARQRITATQ